MRFMNYFSFFVTVWDEIAEPPDYHDRRGYVASGLGNHFPLCMYVHYYCRGADKQWVCPVSAADGRRSYDSPDAQSGPGLAHTLVSFCLG